MTEPNNSSDSRPSEMDDDTISLLDLLIVFAKNKILILGLPFVTAVLAAGISLLLPNVFTGTTKIMPPQSQSSASSMLTQLGGGLAGLIGGAAGLKSPNDIYVAMLKSRRVADKIIQRFDLMKLWKINIQHPSDARKVLASVTKINSDKEGTITIEVDDQNPRRAAELANAYVDELSKLTQVLGVTEASQRRLFFERQFALAKDNLAKAEAAARQALQTRGLVKVDDQGRAMVESTASLRAQITVKEVQLDAMRIFATDRNPQLQFAQEELESLRRELAKIEGTSGAKIAKNSVNGQGADSMRFLRDVKYHESIFELLAKQYELAKIDEAKDSTVIQVLDKAVEPDRRSSPKRTFIVLLSALGALFVGIVWAFVREEMLKAKSDPQHMARFQTFKRYLALR